MKQNPFGDAKKLGFGLMRLPTNEDKTINLPLFKEMVDAFMKNGFTYFDTAYMYHNCTSESAVKEALVDRYPRESYTLTTKLPVWEVADKDGLTPFFDRQREKTGVEYFDYYLLHAVDNGNIVKYDEFECWDWARELKEKGLIRHFGFSFHGTAQLLDELLTKHPEVEFVQLQINYLDWENEVVQSGKCYEVAKKHGMPIMIMEPVKGGTLADLPVKADEILREYDAESSAASWALRFCLSLENVCMILSGMSNPEQLFDNMKTFTENKLLSDDEKALVKKISDTILSIPTVPCTSCEYCLKECVQKLPIPKLIKCLNNARLYGDNYRARNAYKFVTEGKVKASDCIACGACESVCPQHLKISEIMAETAGIYDKK